MGLGREWGEESFWEFGWDVMERCGRSLRLWEIFFWRMRDGFVDGKEFRREGEGVEVISDASRFRDSLGNVIFEFGRDGFYVDKV